MLTQDLIACLDFLQEFASFKKSTLLSEKFTARAQHAISFFCEPRRRSGGFLRYSKGARTMTNILVVVVSLVTRINM